MFSLIRTFTIVLACGACLLGGCATSRDVVSLSPPTPDKLAPSKGKEIYIHSVVDNRIFEAAPKSPNIPSLDPTEPQNKAIKLRAIARKRDTFGKGLGDILLNEEQTVESVIYDSLRQAFIESGYTVIENKANISKSSHVVDVQIDKFWSWMNPGFWAITLNTEIATEITVQNANDKDKKAIYVKAVDSFQTGLQENWLSVMNTALRDYISEVKTKFK